MNKVQVLDCTLRDGGYCNEWHFGYENEKRIIEGLVEADVEIIECGFLTNRVDYNPDVTKFSTLEEASGVIPQNRAGKKYVVMMNHGEYETQDLPVYDGTSVDGIRVAFHKNNYSEALEDCRVINEKGYLVFVQAMLSLNYTDAEFLQLISAVNEIDPYAFYIVDSFGSMREKELIRFFYLIENNLNENIWIGFHSHNNIQLAFSNAQRLANLQTSRNLIIDSSIMGMGRGAGNLNTERFLEYLNENAGKEYRVKPLLVIIDKILNQYYEKNYWGYSLPNYISASHNAHPNYAGYLDEKKTLNYEDMNNIFDMMEEAKRAVFDIEYIEELYLKYQEKDQVQEIHLSDFIESISGKTILMIAPGQSSEIEKEKIIACSKRDDIISISINFEYDEDITKYIFVSNLRRYRDLGIIERKKSIVTSNISSVDAYLQVKYKDLINDMEPVRDNAGLMLIKFLINHGVDKVLIAGMDGYSSNVEENYANQRMSFHTEKILAERKNEGIMKVLKDYSKKIQIEFITTPRYIRLD